MEHVTDGTLLTIAEVSAALIGLFIVGMIFYVQTGFRLLEKSRDVVEPYFRASTRIVLIVYSIPLGVSLTLVTISIGWSRLLLLALLTALVAANVTTVGGLGPVMRATGSRLLLYNEIVGTLGVAAMALLPFVLGGWSPDRDDLVPVILLGLGLGFLSTCVLVLTLFDIAEFERSDGASSLPRMPRLLERFWGLEGESAKLPAPGPDASELGDRADPFDDISG